MSQPSVTFPLITSNSNFPTAAGVSVSAPSGNGTSSGSSIPMHVTALILGTIGSGSPVTKLQVQNSTGTWLDVIGGTVTGTGRISATCHGVAVRLVIPTLTAPGTGTTAPRCYLQVTPLLRTADPYASLFTVANRNVSSGTSTGTNSLTPGFSAPNPSLSPTPHSKTGSFLSLTGGNGSATLQGQYHDSTLLEASTWVNESSSTVSAGQQLYTVGFAENVRASYTYVSSADSITVETFRVEN